MKVKLFTHDDLDGVGCGVVGITAFGRKSIDIEYLSYNNLNTRLQSFIDDLEYQGYDRIFMTDISMNMELAEQIEANYELRYKFQLVDHHGTALWLADKYNWAHVRVEESNLYPRDLSDTRGKVSSSGTSLFYKFLRDKYIPRVEPNSKLKAFVEVVRRYDSWEWMKVYDDNHPKAMNDLLYLIGRTAFVERFSDNPMPTFSKTELALLSVEERRISEYVASKTKEVTIREATVGGIQYIVAYVFAEQNVSLLGNAIAEKYSDTVDFVMLVDVARDKVSLRCVKTNIDLGKDVAKVLGEQHGRSGGGHRMASSFEYNRNFKDDLLGKIILRGD